MDLLIAGNHRLYFVSASTATAAVKAGAALPLRARFLESGMIDDDTETVAVILKTGKADATTIASATLLRNEGAETFSGILNLATEQAAELLDCAEVFFEARWDLAGDTLATVDAKVTVQQPVSTGEEGEPDADQTLADRAAWLEAALTAGSGITLTFNPTTGTATIAAAGITFEDGPANSGKLMELVDGVQTGRFLRIFDPED